MPVPPKIVQRNAAKGLELRQKFGRGGTMVGVARARDLKNGKNIPIETLKRMVSFFARHEKNKEAPGWGDATNPSAGWIANLLWGGSQGRKWAKSMIAKAEMDEVEVDFELKTPGARPGLPWRSGRLYLEHKPSLRVHGRGLGSDPGEYFKLRAMPQVQAALADLRCAVLSSPLIIESTGMPPWLEEDPEATEALAVQKAFIDRVWWKWTRAGEARGLNDWISDVLLFAPVCGFYLGEMVGEAVAWKLGTTDGQYICPRLPELRAPWTVQEWFLEDETPVAVKQTLFQSQDNNGRGGLSDVVIPWERIVHIPFDPAGPSDLEGRSILRGAEVALKILMDVYRLQALAIEVNGLGTVVISKDSETAPDMTDDARDKLETHLKNYKASHVPYLVLPTGYKATWASPQSSVPDLSSQVAIYERMVELALNQTHKGIATRNTGAFAARADASADSRSHIDAHARELVCKPLERIMATFLRLNFPQWAAKDWIFTPRITPQPHDARDLSAEAAALSSLTTAGHIPQHEAITKALLERYGLPVEFVDELAEDDEAEGEPEAEVAMAALAEEVATPRQPTELKPEADADDIGSILEGAMDQLLGQRIEEMIEIQEMDAEPAAFIANYRQRHPIGSEAEEVAEMMRPFFEGFGSEIDISWQEIEGIAIEAGAQALKTTFETWASDVNEAWQTRPRQGDE